MKNKNLFFKHLSKNYTKFPNKMFRLDPVAPLGLIGFYLFLLSLPEEFNPSITFLSNYLLISKTTATKYLQELENRNMIKKIFQGRFTKTNDVYEFTKPIDWRTNEQPNNSKSKGS